MKIGFTTSFPVEVIFAAGHIPVDLNNIFITNKPQLDVREAESTGFPRNVCAWIKGIYNCVLANDIKTVIGIIQGDCSNSQSLLSLFEDKNIDVISFSFPYDQNRIALQNEISKLETLFPATNKQVAEVKAELDDIRRMLVELDKMTYIDNKVTGLENHYWLVNASDFFGDPARFKNELSEFLYQAKERKALKYDLRIAYIGVPPIFLDFYDFFEQNNIAVVFNEVQRQFAMPYLHNNIIDQYLSFTYPYSVFGRIKDIKKEAQLRNIDGIISYSQAFCHRQIDNLLLKKYLPYPFLTVEGDNPINLDERTKLRLESFFDIIGGLK